MRTNTVTEGESVSETTPKPQFKNFIYLGEGARATAIKVIIDRETKATTHVNLDDKIRVHFQMGRDDTDEHVRYIDGFLTKIEMTELLHPTGIIALSPAYIYNTLGGRLKLERHEVNLRAPEVSHVQIIARKHQLRQRREENLDKKIVVRRRDERVVKN